MSSDKLFWGGQQWTHALLSGIKAFRGLEALRILVLCLDTSVLYKYMFEKLSDYVVLKLKKLESFKIKWKHIKNDCHWKEINYKSL